MKKIFAVITLIIGLMLFSTKPVVLAQGGAQPTLPPTRAPSGVINIPQPNGALINLQTILSAGIRLILIVAGLIAFVYLLLGGIAWITSGGDKAGVEKARNQIIQALIGLIVVLAAWGLIIMVEQATGIGLGFSKPLNIPKFY